MTDEIKGFKSPQSPLPKAENRKRPESESASPQNTPNSDDDAVKTSAVESVEAGVRSAAEEVRRAENAAKFEAPPAPREGSRVRTADAGAPTTPPEEDDGSNPLGAADDAPVSSEPIRSPEEATKLAESVAARIRQNPPEALAVNINRAVVQSLFQ